MAHLIGETDGMMYVGETPWHGLGVSLPANPSIADAIKAAGLTWMVKTVPLVTATGRPVDACAVVRVDTDEILCHHTGKKYLPLQNDKAFDWFEPLVSNGDVSIETAGSLMEGRKVWVLGLVKGDPIEIVKGDAVKSYVLLSNAHDGVNAVRVGFTPTRVVCHNTLTMAHNSADSKLLRVKHTSGMEHTLERIRETMVIQRQEFEASCEQFKWLATRAISPKDLETYVKIVFGLPEELKKESKILTSVTELFDTGKGSDIKGVRGTYWGAYNAVTEFMTWQRGKTADARLARLWFGDGVKTNHDAFDVALQMAA